MSTRPQRLPIATRMLVSALVLVLIILPAAGSVLAWNFRASVNSAFDERLESLLNVVLAGVTFDERQGRLVASRQLGDPRFDRVFSGWYWQVSDGADQVLASRSLWDERLPISTLNASGVRTLSGPRDESLRVLEKDIRLPNFPGLLHVSVAADLEEINAEVARFQTLLTVSLVVLGLALVLMIWLQIRWGLAPLRRLVGTLKDVEQGRLDRLDTDVPKELSHLAGAINTVLARDRSRIERGRSAAGNLAHAIKTPVSVLKTLAERLPDERKTAFDAQLIRLDDAVRHHLARASAAGPVTFGHAQPLDQLLDPVLSAIERLCERRGLDLIQRVPTALTARADGQDLQEIVGNLLENAVKWARTQVQFEVRRGEHSLIITVEDDGQGMSDDECARAVDRGTRLDETHSETGLGLAIVYELARLYGGSLKLDRSGLGGLRATATIPT